MKKEYLILIGAILILCAYLFFHKENRDYYALPQIPKVDVQTITGMTIIKDGKSVEFSKLDDTWTLTENAFAADSFLVDNMLAVFKNFELSTLVSQQGTMERYELDAANGIQVKLLQKDKTILDVTMGKTAMTFNHTFVKFPDNDNVYYAVGSFRTHFEKSVADYRDKKVMTFPAASIKQFTIKKDGLVKTYTATPVKDDKNKETLAWKTRDDQPADKKEISQLLTTLGNLSCEKYMDTPVDQFLATNKLLGEITLKGNPEKKVALFETKDDNTLTGISSMSKYAFAMDKNSGRQILANIDKLFGMETTQEQEK